MKYCHKFETDNISNYRKIKSLYGRRRERGLTLTCPFFTLESFGKILIIGFYYGIIDSDLKSLELHTIEPLNF